MDSGFTRRSISFKSRYTTDLHRVYILRRVDAKFPVGGFNDIYRPGGMVTKSHSALYSMYAGIVYVNKNDGW